MRYTCRIGLGTKDVPGAVDQIMDAMDGYAPTVATTLTGLAEATVTVEAATLRQAVSTALALGESAGVGDVVGVEVMPETEHDRRFGLDLPKLLSVTEAAGRLGVSRQAVLQRLESGSLPGQKVGSTWVVPAVAVR